MSPVTVCLFVVSCAAYAVAGPISIKSSDFHFGNQEIASIESASAQLPTDIDSKRITQDLSIETVPHASELDREVTSYHKRVRRSIMNNGKCAQGYVKVGNACMDCKELDLCD